MKDVKDLIPWTVTDISVYPYGPDYWSINPSIHVDTDGTWRCIARICDYSMPSGTTVRSKLAGPVGQQTRNAMIIFDPQTWKPIRIYKMRERDDLPRAVTPHLGYEDMRLFRTDKGGLQGIAASLHLKRDPLRDAQAQSQPPEQVLLSFDTDYDIVRAQPIRGSAWSGTPQKNWVPFDHCAEPRFLYSIDKGTMFDDRGPVLGDEAGVSPSIDARLVDPITLAVPQPEAPPDPPREDPPLPQPLPVSPSAKPPALSPPRWLRVAVDTLSTRPSRVGVRTAIKSETKHVAKDAPSVKSSAGMILPGYKGLRGGSQLTRVGDDAWLGIGHEMTFVDGRKFYWHEFYLVDSRGKLLAVSPPCKLAAEGIEFAAGMAIDGDRIVVSFGVDDMLCRLGETSLGAVMGILQRVVH